MQYKVLYFLYFCRCNFFHYIHYIKNEIMSISSENVKSQMRKGLLEYCIMLIISKRSVYVSDIIKELKEARLIVVEGTLYPLLSRLKNSGLLTYQWQESLQGPPRKYYNLTEEGKLFLEELENAWDEINNTVHSIRSTTAE